MTPETALSEIAIKQNLEQFLLVLLVSLSVATISRLFVWFRRIPFTLLLVIVGLILAFGDIRLVNLSPELILEIFLPPLLFEASWNMKWRELQRDLIPVTLFAIVGVIISVVGIAFGLSWFAGIPGAIALLVGASLSATDPISVVALLKELGASQRLKTLMEGESLFNDGVAVVAFSILVAIPMGTSEFSVSQTLLQFFTFVGIGAGVGCLIGFGISYLTQRFDSPLVEQSLTLVSAYGTYVVTEQLGGSGVIGVVIVGLILGNFGSRIGMNPRTRIIVSEFWEFLAFFVNSIVFLLIGDQIQFPSLAANIQPILIAIAGMIITRAMSTYGLSAISNGLANSKINFKIQTILWWGGLRGSVSIALALSVPTTLQQRDEIIATVFGVVLFTLLVQGLTTQPLLNILGLIGDQPLQQEYQELLARRVALNRVRNHLSDVIRRQEVEPEFYRYQAELVNSELTQVQEKLDQLQEQHPQLQEISLKLLLEEMVDIEANTYAELIRSGRLDNNISPILWEVFEGQEEKQQEVELTSEQQST
ncbi:Na+/H+ antiporter [Limnoraphis robusta Tam1]|uniref:Na+/H+ antiporter n=1 Tax=Limnoraphis robusta CCNP1315 TaxID=3110306 RepID=A0ABU5U637_9CYAN|nr:Na+/H+ antiporter [Limnoraphis robusta]MEA5522616.1 Na+/H+ antiporter [Limnoraphis robusta CCNP1315]MEA5541918.1 Na+/H+ antiporter [Limnoraphis robusta Tam1]MEA5546527.1 Na+/H+ antiporter [Limnoraphis robusta CCNP1324]